MKKNLILFSLLFLGIILNYSCTKDDDSPNDFESISFNGEEILNTLPDGLTESDDPYAQQAVGYVESSLSWADFDDQMVPDDNAVSDGNDSYSWSWPYFGYSLTLWWTFDEDSQKKYWDIDISYMEAQRANYISAWEYKDGSGGEILYNFTWVCLTEESPEDCEDLYWKYTWEKDDQDNYTFTYLMESDDDDYQSTLKYITVVNNDGSGSVNYYLMDELVHHMEWDATGAGSWTEYYGDMENSGSWPAA